tara:strand:- start:6316 stop:6606 length:291 start_codon:yes stop_codon:yes gene_type:complete
MPRLRVNSIVNRSDDGAIELPYGASFPAGTLLTVNSNASISGIATIGILTSTNMNSGVVTATSFRGDGSGITALPTVTASKAIALKIILDPLPFRS